MRRRRQRVEEGGGESKRGCAYKKCDRGVGGKGISIIMKGLSRISFALSMYNIALTISSQNHIIW